MLVKLASTVATTEDSTVLALIGTFALFCRPLEGLSKPPWFGYAWLT